MEQRRYAIVKANYLTSFEIKVEQYLAEGWIPQGGVHVINDDQREEYHQAMTKNVFKFPTPAQGAAPGQGKGGADDATCTDGGQHPDHGCTPGKLPEQGKV